MLLFSLDIISLAAIAATWATGWRYDMAPFFFTAVHTYVTLSSVLFVLDVTSCDDGACVLSFSIAISDCRAHPLSKPWTVVERS